MEYSTSVSQQQELQTDRQRPYSTSQQHSDGNWSFTNVLNIEENKGTTSGTIGEAKNPMKFIPEPLFIILGSTYCLVILCILLVVPILELAIGAAYRNQCTINSNIPVYLIVTGACGIASIVLTMAIVRYEFGNFVEKNKNLSSFIQVGAFICCFKQESAPGSIAIGCVIGVIFLFLFLMGLFLFIWFIVVSRH
jgi:hypothetical protein